MLVEDYKIYPVIEMSPWRMPGGMELFEKVASSKLLGKEFYDKFVLDAYKKQGIQNIRSLDKYQNYSFRISNIIDDDLTILIETEIDYLLCEIDELEAEDVRALAFDGGLVIESSNGLITQHSCCGTISHYKNWLNFISDQPTDWKEIWIGHPWIYGRIRNNIIQLTGHGDETTSKPNDDDSDIKWQFELYQFEQKLNKAIKEINKFKKRVKSILTAKNIKYANVLSEDLIEGPE